MLSYEGGNMNKIILFLLNEKGYRVLSNIIEKGYAQNIKYVVYAKDSALTNDFHSDIIELCQEVRIDYYYRTDRIPLHNGFKLAVGWRWLIEDASQLIVLHDSLLPKYRGASPVQSAIKDGLTET